MQGPCLTAVEEDGSDRGLLTWKYEGKGLRKDGLNRGVVGRQGGLTRG